MMSRIELPIPVSILTGFLGAGKTTLVNRLLKDPALTDTAVIVNEFGEIAIDHLLVEKASDGVIELGGGCLCCSVRGELVDTLLDLLERQSDGRIARLARVIVETTGLADPVPVLQSLMAHPILLDAYRLDGVVTVVDAVHGGATLDNHVEAVRQVAVADRIVVSKRDLPEALGQAADDLARRLRMLNPNAAIVDGRDPAAGIGALLACGLYDPATKTGDVRRWLGEAAVDTDGHDAAHRAGDAGHGHAPGGSHHHHGEGKGHVHDHEDPHGGGDVHRHDHRVRSLSLIHPAPLSFAAIETFLHLLRSTQGERLLRLKAIVELAEDPRHPLVVHSVQTLFHPPARLPAWPDATRGTRMVLIGIDLDDNYLRRLFDAIAGRPALDTPDRAAIERNPLAIMGA